MGPMGENSIAKCAIEASPAPMSDKHIQIDNAIASLQSVEKHLRDLIARVAGSNLPEEAKAERPVPSLVEILNDGTARINETEATLHTLIDQLENLLYR